VNSLAQRRRHRLAAPTLVLLTIALIGVLYAAIGNAATATADGTAKTTANSEQIEAGKQLFAEGCSSCHGLGAQGGPEAPTLIGVGAAAVDFQVSTGRMPLATPQAQAPKKPVMYSDEEIAQLAAFVASLAPGPAIPTEEQIAYEGADLAEGGELFRTNCSQCHNFSGTGGALSNGAYAPNLTEATPRQIYEAMITGPANMPVFGNETLTIENKQAIIKYIRQMDEQPSYGGWAIGSLGPVNEGLFIWIVGIGGMIAAAVWIGAKVR
jgi:ubiquinol-cytochrome c reductase cytochrome c subunit